MPKTIAILAPSAVPFEIGGAEKFWWGLRNALASHSDAFVDLIKLPCREKSFVEIVDTYETFSRLDLSHFDMLITTKYPAWIAPHANHVCYMQHTLRGLYDTYAMTGLPDTLGRPPSQLNDLLALIRKPEPTREDLPAAFELCRKALASRALPSALFAFPGPLIREVVHFFDRVALAPGQIKAYLAISRNVANRRDYLPADAAVKILPHPSDLTGFHNAPGKYFFTASRLHSNKRVRLIADAMRHVPLDIPLKIAGTGPELNMLRERFAHDPRIEFLGFVPDDQLVGLYAEAICVPYAPMDEDYGLITIEAMQSGKPVITTPDAGGVREFVEDGQTGFVVEPYPPSMAAAMTRLAKDAELAAELGRKARQKVADINWPANVAALLAHATSVNGQPRPAVLVCAPFAANEHGAGGPRRLHHFCKQLAREYEVRLVCYGSRSQSGIKKHAPAPGVKEIALPWPDSFQRCARGIAEQTNQSSDDMAIMRQCAADPALREILLAEKRNAVCCVASHPWLYPAIRQFAPDLPLVYDAHNVEADMKEAVFGPGAIAEEVKALESELAATAAQVFACAKRDAARLAGLYNIAVEKIEVLPSGCDAPEAIDKAVLRKRLAFSETPIAIFVGSDHRPNVEAALAVFDMARQLPQVQFLLLGSVCYPPAVAKIPRPDNLHLIGPVSEKLKRVLLARADIALNPVISGSGVNLKIMEYLANGLICVSTPFGCRGMPEDLAPALQITPLEDFPAKIHSLLASPPECGEIAPIAARIACQFDWNASMAPLCKTLASRLKQEKACAPAD